MKILILGAGAIGSNLTNRLVADLRGEHQITVLDHDEIEERNIIAGTQFYMRDQIGMSKVEALQYNIYKFHEKEIKIINGDLTKVGVQNDIELIIDCLDNNKAREVAQSFYSWKKNSSLIRAMSVKDVLHIGFSDQFTFAIEWAENYQIPEDIVSGMDICEMPGASTFIGYVVAVSSHIMQQFLNHQKKIDVIGNKLNHKIVV